MARRHQAQWIEALEPHACRLRTDKRMAEVSTTCSESEGARLVTAGRIRCATMYAWSPRPDEVERHTVRKDHPPPCSASTPESLRKLVLGWTTRAAGGQGRVI